MNLLTNRINFKKTGLLLLVILFFLSCRKDKSKIGVDDPNRIPSYTYFTDTVTVKSSIVLITDSINTTNVSGDGTNSYFMAGAYHDDLFGNIAVEAYSRLRLSQQFVELPAAVADSGFLYLNYSYYYGDTTDIQTLNIYKLTDEISTDDPYFSNSPATSYDPTPIGSINFYASGDTGVLLKIPIDDAYLQTILDASKNNKGFQSEIKGIAIVPANNVDGAIIRIDGNSAETMLQIHYTQYTESKTYNLNLNGNARKYYRVVADRSGTDLASLVNNYDSISSDALTSNANRCFIQACTGIRTRISFPYLHKLKEAFPNIALMHGELTITPSVGSDFDTYSPNSGLLLIRTEDGKIKRTSGTTGGIFYVQPDDRSQTVNTNINNAVYTDSKYSFKIKTYLQAVLLEQVPNNPIIISPALLFTDINRVAFNNYENSTAPMRLNLYFVTTK